MPPVSRKRLACITGLRGLAALYVLLSHVWSQIWPAVAPPYGYGREPDGLIAWLSGWLYYGHFGVVVFLVLSGFCLMLPVVENGGALPGGTRAFLARRAWRILPPYYCAMAFSLLLIVLFIGEKTGSQWDISLPVSIVGFLAHLLLLHDLVEATQINYVFWSIALEVQLYLLFPPLVAAWHRFGALRVAACAIAMVYGTVLVLSCAGVDAVPPQFIGLCACFVLGMGGATLLHHRETRWLAYPWGKTAAVLLALLSGLCAWWGHAEAERHLALLDLLCALATVALLLGAARARPGDQIRSALEAPALVAAGTFSYSLYLVHAPLLQLIWQYAIQPLGLPDAGQFGALLLTGVPASLGVAWMFFQGCEKHFAASCRPEGIGMRRKEEWPAA